MGTNFYIRLTVKSRKEDRTKAINRKLFDELHEKFVSIHIGKRSYGWKFLFNAHKGELYELTKEGINKYIKENKAGIFDEYGGRFTIDQFWNEEITPDKGHDLRTYYRDNPSEENSYIFRHFKDSEYDWSKKYLPNAYGEFYHDGLRFTLSSEFS